MNSLNNFLSSYSVKNTNKPSTHTRIGDKELGIYGGNYSIPKEEQETFWKLYYEDIIIKDKNEYLTEKQDLNGTIAIDLDFRYNNDITIRQHTDDDIANLVGDLSEILKKYYHFKADDSFEIFICEKPNVNQLADGSLTKDGIHIVIGLNMDRETKLNHFRKDIMELFANTLNKLPLINDWDSVVDEGIFKTTTNWQLFGSKKPANQKYQLVKAYNLTYDATDGNFMIDGLDTTMTYDLFKRLSIQNLDRPTISTTKVNSIKNDTNFTLKKPYSPTSVTEFPTNNIINTSDNIYKYLNCIGSSMCDTGLHSQTIKVLQILKNEDIDVEYVKYWIHTFANPNSKKYTYAIEYYTDGHIKFTPLDAEKRVSMKSLIYYARQNKELYKTYFPNEEIEIDLWSPIFSSGMIADYFKTLYPNQFIFCDDVLYFWNKIYWEKDDKRNSNLTKFIESTFIKDLINYVNAQIRNENLQEIPDQKKMAHFGNLFYNINTLRQVKIRKSFMEDIINKVTDNKAEFNKKPNLFVFDNCVINLLTKEHIKPNPKDLLTISCGYNYQEAKPEDIIELNTFIDSIFPENEIKNHYLEILATGLCGYQQEKLFIATGCGGNGKGVINQLMLKTVGNYGYKLPSSLLLAEIKSGPNPEVAKLDGIRYGLITEPDKKKNIVASTLKEITGEPVLNARDIYSSKCKIELALSLVMEANDLPPIDEVNDAIYRRIDVTPFVAKAVSQEDYDAAEDKTNLMVGNPYYKSVAFQEQYRYALFSILSDKYKKFAEKKFILQPQPKQCVALCQKYLANSDDFYGWWIKTFEKDITSIMTIKSAYKLFTEDISQIKSMSRRGLQESNSASKFEELVSKNMFLRKTIIARKAYFNNKQISATSITGWKVKEDIEELEL